MRTQRSRRRAFLPILLAVALSVSATVVAGIPPSSPGSIADSAFVPVTLDARPSDLAARTSDAPAEAPAEPIADPWLLATPPADRAQPKLPVASPIAVQRPRPTPAPGSAGVSGSTSGSSSSTSHATSAHSITGRASWYCDAGVSACTVNHPDTSGFDAYAAAGPGLRAAIGPHWRGMVITVDGVRVKLIDWCQCYKGEPNEKLLDLYHDVFLRTGSPVTLRW